MKFRKGKKLIIAVFVFVIFLCSGYNISAIETSVFSAQVKNPVIGDSLQIELAGDTIIYFDQGVLDNYLHSDFSFLRLEQTNRLGREVGKTFLNSIFAILFKIAVISGSFYSLFTLLESVRFLAKYRIMDFIHNGDGKKGRFFFVSEKVQKYFS